MFVSSISVACLTSVRETEGPESQVGGRVGDTAQTVLNGVDGLVDHDLSKLKLSRHNSNS